MATPEEIKAASDKALGLSLDKAATEQAAKNAAQVEADQKTANEALAKVPIVVTGDAVLGGPFNIYGIHFGPRGTLRIGDREITVGRWDDNVIGGSLLPGTRGAVVLTTSSGVRHGTFPHVSTEGPTKVEVTVNVDGKPTTPVVK